MATNEFTIDPKLLDTVQVEKRMKFTAQDASEIPIEFTTAFDGSEFIKSTGFEDTPEFTELRNHLAEHNFIKKETRWWNGDYVTSPFKLNGYLFSLDQQFPCAAALRNRLK